MKSSISYLFFLLSIFVFLPANSFKEDVSSGMRPTMVERGERRYLMVSEYGEISAVDIKSGRKGSYHLEFMTLEPNSLFLPVLLHADMVFYVNTGIGKLSWSEDGKAMKRMDIKRGDVYRLHAGSVFFMQSYLETERQKLRVYSIFPNTDEDNYVPSIGAYSSISDLVLGFDWKLLQSAFMVPEDVIEEMKSAVRPPAIVHASPEKKKKKKSVFGDIESRLVEVLIGNKGGPFYEINGSSKKTKTFNILEADPDFENCNGWSVTVDRKDLKSLRGSNTGIFMVNLTKGSMMGPHWNPMATEIAVVLQGEGMVRMVCASNVNETGCRNKRFRVKEGDVFATPRFYPMSQMSFNNGSFVFMGFSTSTRKNHPQFLAGKRSVLLNLNKDILASAFNVTNSAIDALLKSQEEAIILDCTFCAEEEEIRMEREKQEEEAREREEEKKREEEERRKREEEEQKREKEERRKREEEEQKREEEERRKREEEEHKREEEERKRERREREHKAAEKRREEERRRREERARKEQEEARRQEEERQRRQREKEEEARKEREREEEEHRRQEEEERQRRQREKEEEARKEREREEEEHRRQEEEESREQEEKKREKERRERELKEMEERQEEERRRREEQARREQEEARRQEEERQRRQREKEEAARKEREREEEGSEAKPVEDGGGTRKEGKRRILAARKARRI